MWKLNCVVIVSAIIKGSLKNNSFSFFLLPSSFRPKGFATQADAPWCPAGRQGPHALVFYTHQGHLYCRGCLYCWGHLYSLLLRNCKATTDLTLVTLDSCYVQTLSTNFTILVQILSKYSTINRFSKLLICFVLFSLKMYTLYY